MNSQIDEFERIMLDYLKGEISSERYAETNYITEKRECLSRKIS